MSLIDEMMDDCIIMNKEKVDDGEGGSYTEWKEGPEIKAAIILDSSMNARVAEREGVTSVYTITTTRQNALDYHEVIKRKKDGKYFRVTSDKGDKQAPIASTLDMAQVSAEKWELTT